MRRTMRRVAILTVLILTVAAQAALGDDNWPSDPKIGYYSYYEQSADKLHYRDSPNGKWKKKTELQFKYERDWKKNNPPLVATFLTPDDHKPSGKSKPLVTAHKPAGHDLIIWGMRAEIDQMRAEMAKMKKAQESMVKDLRAWIWKHEKRQVPTPKAAQ